MKIKHILSALLTVLLILSGLVVVSASDTAALSKKGSVTLMITEPEDSKGIGSLNLYKVADAAVTDSSLEFRWASPFKDDVDLTDAENLDKGLAERLAVIAETAIPFKKNVTFDSGGKIKFEDLEAGLYLITQTSAEPGYTEIRPFWVTVPHKNTDGTLTYDVKVEPKVTVAHSPSASQIPIEIINDTSLPQTGQLWWPVVPLAIIGSLLLSVGIIMRYGDEKNT